MGMLQTCLSANLQCVFGAAPSTLTVLPVNMVLSEKKPGATIMEHIPIMNISPFGVCNCITNPMVEAATAAAFGVLTPMPCVPMTTAPWVPTSPPLVLIKGKPRLNQGAILTCNWGGVINITMAGQTKTIA